MFNQYVDDVKQQIKYYTNLRDILTYLYNQRIDFIDILEYCKQQIKAIPNETSSNISTEFSSSKVGIELKELAIDILSDYARAAIKATKEFDLYEFESRLIQAIRNPQTITISSDPVTGKVSVKIDLNRTAGNLKEYVHAVDAARRQLEIGKYRANPLPAKLAAHMWKEKYYGPAREGKEIPQPKRKPPKDGRKPRSDKKEKRDYNTAQYVEKYFQTIRTRLANMRSLAPYWKILDQGTVASISNERTGYAYPSFGRTNFVENARREILSKVQEYTNEKYSTSNTDIKELRQRIIKLEQAIKYIDEVIQKVEQRISISKQKTTYSAVEFAYNKIVQALDARFSFADKNRIIELANKLASGEEISKTRVELTQRGSGRRVRQSIKRLQKIVREYKGS